LAREAPVIAEMLRRSLESAIPNADDLRCYLRKPLLNQHPNLCNHPGKAVWPR